MPPHSALAALGRSREQVIARLSDAFAADDLDVDTFELRVSQAHRADSEAALAQLVADLSPAASTDTSGSHALQRAAGGVQLRADGGTSAPARIRARFSAVERRGAWSVPANLRIQAAFSAVVLDLREADFVAGVTEVSISARFAAVEIIVPPGLPVVAEGNATFGAFEHMERAPRELPQGGAVLRITGNVLFGAVKIDTRLPGESEGQARRRHRRELGQGQKLLGARRR